VSDTRRHLTIALLAILIALPTGTAFAWKFASIADSQGSDNGVSTGVLTTIVNQIKAENVDLVILSGDLVSGATDITLHNSMYDTWLGVMNQLNCPWYVVPGNHDINDNAACEAAFVAKTNMPMNGPAGYKGTVYSFDHNNAHFVGLNSNHPGMGGTIGSVELSWLATDLANTTQPHIFTFCHQPHYDPYPTGGLSDRDTLWSAIGKAGVMMSFCGHIHYFKRTQCGDVMQVINSSVGGELVTGVPGTVAAYNYLLVSIDGNKVHCEAKYDTGVTFDTWEYTVLPNCGDASSVPDATMPTLLVGKIVTKVRGTTCWVEDDKRSAACQCSATPIPSVGDKVNILGTFKTLTTGERELQGSALVISSGNVPPKPVLMTVKTLLGGPEANTPGMPGAAGLNNYGLLVKVAGKVTAVGTGADAGYYYIDDGSGIKDGTSWDGKENAGVRIKYGDTLSKGAMATVTGVVSIFKNGSQLCRMLYCG